MGCLFFPLFCLSLPVFSIYTNFNAKFFILFGEVRSWEEFSFSNTTRERNMFFRIVRSAVAILLEHYGMFVFYLTNWEKAISGTFSFIRRTYLQSTRRLEHLVVFIKSRNAVGGHHFFQHSSSPFKFQLFWKCSQVQGHNGIEEATGLH